MSVSDHVQGLVAVTLEVRDLEVSEAFYQGLGLLPEKREDTKGQRTLQVGEEQSLRLWKPLTKQRILDPIRPRGGSHVHYAMKIPKGTSDDVISALEERGIPYDLHDFGVDDTGIYFYDPDLHQVELRESTLYTPGNECVQAYREVVLEFKDLKTAHHRLTEVYGFQYSWGDVEGERAFTAYRFAKFPKGQHLNAFTELYCWDPQIGIAGGQPGEHVYLTVTYPEKGFAALKSRVRAAGLDSLEEGESLFVRDPEGHVFEFQPC